ncbi:MAG: FAD-dependent oxidoreductase, partial [Dehalococcoidia bacterium]
VAAHYYQPQRSRFRALGDAYPPFDFASAMAEKEELIGTLRQSNYVEVLASFGGVVTLYEGRARFRSPNEVEMDGQIVHGEQFLIATGSRPSILPFPGIDGVQYITSREAMEIRGQPRRLIVVGAGPTGLELGQFFARLGTQVTVLEKMPQVLPRVEPEVADELQRCLEGEGIQVHCACDIERVWQEGEVRYVEAQVSGQRMVFAGDHLLLATGVQANSDGLGLEAAGVRTDQRGFIEADEQIRTSAPHIYAAGDVVGRMLLETVAAKEGYVAARNALEEAGLSIDYDSIPAAVFTDPQVATVGLTEEEEMQRYQACACRTVEMAKVPKAAAVKEDRGLIKMVIHPEDSKVLGVHIVAPQAAEMIHEATVAVRFGLTIDNIIDTVHVFPTFSEGIKLVAQAFTRDISVMSCCIQ